MWVSLRGISSMEMPLASICVSSRCYDFNSVYFELGAASREYSRSRNRMINRCAIGKGKL